MLPLVFAVAILVGCEPTMDPQRPEARSEFLPITTPNGIVSVKNFYKNPQTHAINDEGDLRIFENFSYDITYFPKNQSFLISISDADIWTVRTDAEENFLKILGINEISKQSACSLAVTLAVSKFANEYAAGTDYGLSFCPNGIPFPAQENNPFPF